MNFVEAIDKGTRGLEVETEMETSNREDGRCCWRREGTQPRGGRGGQRRRREMTAESEDK